MRFDQGFVSAFEALDEFEKKGSIPFVITVRRGDSLSFSYRMKITEDIPESYFYVKKIVLTLLWAVGGTEIVCFGSHLMSEYLKEQADKDEELKKSVTEMENVFCRPFVFSETDHPIPDKEKRIPFSSSFDGCRIGFDAGGSDRKVTATIDGNVVFSEEVLWQPKLETDYHFHYAGVMDSLSRARSHLPRVDAIGISTAGIVIDNEMAQAALFHSVPEGDRNAHVRPFFIDMMKKEFPDVPYLVANDGDVSAMGGYLLFHKNSVLGIALGTSEAAGYCIDGAFTGWINEFGKVPFNYDRMAVHHYSMGISGAGSEYLSQKGIIRLCKNAGISFDGTLAEQLVQIQKEAENGNPLVLQAYEDMGEYLGSALMLYRKFFSFSSVLLLGRVLTGKGGDILTKKTEEYLRSHHVGIEVFTANEEFKRLGQSYIAAGL